MNRKGFIGGSDCVKIMQGKWLELWQVKTGREQPEDLTHNLAVQLGNVTEDFNLSWFEKEHKGCILSDHQREYEKDVGGVPVRGTIDAFWNSKSSVIEAKHTNTFWKMDDVAEYYMPQIQLYAALAQAKGIYLSVIFGNSGWSTRHVAFDHDYLNSMWAVVQDFWGYVERDEEPIGIDTPDVPTDSIKIDEMVKRDATSDNMFVDAAVTYINGLETNKTFERAKKDLKDMVGSNEREVYCDYLTVKRDKRGGLRITKR